MAFPPYTLTGDLNRQQRDYASDTYTAFGERLAAEEVVRFLIDATPGFGHQSATISLVRRFAQATDDSRYGFGYGGTIEIYGDLDLIAPDETLTLRQKIFSLLPELGGQNQGTLAGATVELKLQGTDIPAQQVNFGFSGGYDLLNIIPGSYTDLKTKFLLIIQPYKYNKVIPESSKPGNVVFFGKDEKYILIQVIDKPLLPNGSKNIIQINLFDRAFFIPIFEISDNQWLYYYNNSDDKTRNALRVLNFLSGYFQNPFSFGVLYGVNYPNVSVFRDPVWDRLALTVASLWTARTLNPAATKPPIIIHFGAYDPAANYASSFGNIRGLALGGMTPEEENANDSLIAAEAGEQALSPPQVARFRRILQCRDARRLSWQRGMNTDRFSFVDARTIANPDALRPFLGWLSEANYRVLFVQAGFVPPPIFNYYMKHIDLPAIFEGPNTAVVAINAGCSYLNTDTIGSVNSGRIRYPTGTIGGADITADAAALQAYANQIQASFGAWPQIAADAPSDQIGRFVNQVQDPQNLYRQYFGSVNSYYRDVLNDKFSLAACILEFIAQKTLGVGVSAAIADDAPPSDLASLLALLEQLIAQSSSVDLLNDVFPSGGIHDSYTSFLTGYAGQMVVDGAAVSSQTGEDGNLVSVTLKGTSQAFFLTTDTVITLTAPDGGIYADSAFSNTSAWFLDGAPWLQFGAPVFHMCASDAGGPPSLSIDTTIPSADAAVSIGFPFGGGALSIEGSFSPPKTVADFMSLVGGVDIVGRLPQALQNLAGFGVQSLSISYDQAAGRLSDITLTIGTTAPWPLLNNLEVQSITATVRVENPADMASRAISSTVSGVLIVNSQQAAGIEVSAQFPDMQFCGQLYGSSLSVDDIISVFWPGGQPSWPDGKTPQITTLSLTYGASDGSYSADVTLQLDWPVTIGGQTILTLGTIGLQVSGGTGYASGGLSGTFILLPDSANIGMSVSALYLGTGAGWKFQAQQTSGVIHLADLVKTYLGWDPGLTLDIDGVSLTVETNGPSFEFSGQTAGAWQIPISTGVTVTGALTVGYNGGSGGLDGPGLPLGLARVPLTRPLLAADPKTGFYAKISADITWENIEITLTAEMAPGSYTYMVTWGLFSGALDTAAQTVSITFAGSTTVGSMVETFISWLTGSSYGLVAPWDLLNDIPLGNFSMQWDFGKKTVSFTVDIGPIELGIAKITGITLTYVPEGETRGAHIELQGEFRWQADPATPLGWNAADPAATPAAPGQGNKYIDLRLLAGGQHVSLPDVVKADTVQQAIAAMRSLTPPVSGEIPDIGFDPSINWVFGTDFGVLRIDDGEESDDPYVVTLQIVFDDPVLYGLRLALAGQAAKIFSGLDFQIMYRKLGDALGVYQAEITLPTLMRRIDVGAYTITLPTFGVQIYTNGDFQFDIGFPWNQDFSRSFTVEAIIPPGIPMVGSGGFYFGKLPPIAVSQLPAATNGSFNPNLVFGFGAQLGFGKSVDIGILSAGFSLTLFGIIEGVLAKWNPYDGTSTGGGGVMTLEGNYFFWLQGTFGILGHLYGTVDFVVVKAEVNIDLEVYAQITFASYQSIPITVYASVDASASIEIDLGLFSITINFHFSVQVKETIVIGALQNPADAPWTVATRSDGGRLLSPMAARLSGPAPAAIPAPQWNNLLPSAAPAALTLYGGFGLTVAGDAAFRSGGAPSQQVPCYVATLAIQAPQPYTDGDRSGADKAAGQAPDTSFDLLCKMVARWGIAALQSTPLTAQAVDALIVTDDQLEGLIGYLSDPANPPIGAEAIGAFLGGQFLMTASAPTQKQMVAAYFPMPPDLTLNLPAYGGNAALSYDFGGYNAVTPDFMAWLRDYFSQLAIQVQQEQKPQAFRAITGNDELSVGSFIFGDYFHLILRQMLQAFRDGLRDFQYELKSDDTGNGIVAWINDAGQLPADKIVTLYDLFQSNNAAALTIGKLLRLPYVSYTLQEGDSFTAIAAQTRFGEAFDAKELASANKSAPGILAPGAQVSYLSELYTVMGDLSLDSFAEKVIKVSLDQLLDGSDILTSTRLLQPAGALTLPPFPHAVATDDTLLSIAAQYGIQVIDLAGVDRSSSTNPIGTTNGDIADLFDAGQPLHVTHLVQFQVAALIGEAQRAGALQHLSGMVSRYYFHGLRLPTDKITPLKPGMWVTPDMTLPPDAGLFALTGQQFAIPALGGGLSYTVSLSSGPAWLRLDGGSLSFTVTPPTDQQPAGDINYQRYRALTDYATETVLDSGLLSLGAGDMVQTDALRYPLSGALPWSSAAAITFPSGGASMNAQPRLWPLPTAMTSLPDPQTPAGAPLPAFTLELQRYDEATGATTRTALTQFGWSSSVQFTVKKLPPGGGAAYQTTYEVTGASAANALILERIVQAVGDNDAAFAGLVLGYQAGTGANATLTANTSGTVSFGVAQVNLSTVTRPPEGFADALIETGPGSLPTLLTRPSRLVRLLWEAAITRAGGFYLYYVDTATGDGLPDSIFNDRGEATISLIALYPADQPLAPFVNAVATGDPMDMSSAALIAVTKPQTANHLTSASDSLQSIADSAYTTILSVLSDNSGLALAPGAALSLQAGSYMVQPGGAAPGGALSAIAAYFGMPADAIIAANPRIPPDQWQSGLPDWTAIRLPAAQLTVGTSPGGASFAAMAGYYGTAAASLAGYNSTAAGLLAPGQNLTLTIGPIAEVGARIVGIQAIAASRRAAPTIPDDPTDPTYAQAVLLNLYEMLAYQLVANQDFGASNLGLPLGPKVPANTGSASKIRPVRFLNGTDPLNYGKSLPYLGLATNAPPGPYGANGRLLQLAYDWNDLYGNRLVTDLDQPNSPFGTAAREPILLGYTDALIAVSQWPSIAGSWTVSNAAQTGFFTLSLAMSFDPAPYNPSADDKQDVWKQRALSSLQTVNAMMQQYGDPNGIAFWFDSTLLSAGLAIPSSQIGTPQSSAQTLLGWLAPIQSFLEKRSQGDGSAPVPAVLDFTFHADADKSKVTAAQVFRLSLSLRIDRPGGIAEAAFAALPSILSVSGAVAAKASANTATDALSSFAADIRDILSIPGSYSLQVATGIDRTAPQQGSPAIWAIRVGVQNLGISFSLNDPGSPEIYAPRPVSNQLVSRAVTVRSYTAIGDFDPETNSLTGPQQTISFTGIDADAWVQQFFGSFDSLLSPGFVSPMLVIDARATNLPMGVTSLLQSLADTKETLAQAAAVLMAPVFAEQATTRQASATEALRQQLLGQLSSLYTTRAAVSFGATVIADIPQNDDAAPPPALFGAVGWTIDDPDLQSQVTFSSPKLPLVGGDNQPLTFLVEAPQMLTIGAQGVVDRITLALDYAGSAIEHQIAALPGVKNYFASTWLSAVLPDALSPFVAELGSFDLPMLLRGFPATPRMTAQLGVATNPASAKLGDLTLWTYSFTYGLDYHYEQDIVYCEVEYNLMDQSAEKLAGLIDSFPQMAQFMTALPTLQSLLRQTVPAIDAQTTDQTAIDNAAQVVGAYLKMASDIAAAAQSNGLSLMAHTPPETGADAYAFHITEETASFVDAQGKQVTDAWVIRIVSAEGPPSGLSDAPIARVDGISLDQTHLVPSLSDPAAGIYAYYYLTPEAPLRGGQAQAIPRRTIALPGLQILSRQDAKTTVHLSRNENLVPGKTTAQDFVYVTPDVSFANPYHPTIASDTAVNIATLGSSGGQPVSRSLDAHLTALFAALFQSGFSGQVTIQMGVGYSYAFASTLTDLAIALPVALQPPLAVLISGEDGANSLANMIESLSNAILTWFASFTPSPLSGALGFDCTIMSNLTRQPMPLLQLTGLTLPIAYVTPPPISLAAE